MTYWCDRGVDAWRLDAAYAVPPAFWRDVLPRVRERHPDVWVVGEVLHGDYAGYVAESGHRLGDPVRAVEGGLELAQRPEPVRTGARAHRHGEMVATFLPQTFVGNHDVTRLASRLDDARHLPLALALLFALPGVPTVYYGDEFGLRGVKEDRAGGDDAVRPPLPESDAAARARTPPRSPTCTGCSSGCAGGTPGWPTPMIEEPDVLSNEVLAVRLTSGENALAVVLNVGDAPADVRLPMAGRPPWSPGRRRCTTGRCRCRRTRSRWSARGMMPACRSCSSSTTRRRRRCRRCWRR